MSASSCHPSGQNTPPRISLHLRKVGELNLHFACCGQPNSPLVIFLHGFPEYWASWQPQLEAMGETHFAVAPDLRGFNGSDKPAGFSAYRASQVVADIVALADALGHQQFALVGHDWGAAIAYATAITHPTRVSRMVIVNGVHPWAFARELAQSHAQMKASDYIELFRTPEASSHLMANDCAYLQDMFKENGQLPAWMTPEVLTDYLRAWRTPGALNASLNYYRASPLHPSQDGKALHFDPAPMRIEAHTLQLWGERDRFLMTGCSQNLEPVLPHLHTVRFPHGSHWLVHEEPDTVSRLIRTHLNAGGLGQ